MNNRKVFYYFTKCIERGGGCRLTREQELICRRALSAFLRGARDLYDCYKRPSNAKQSEYLQCEALCMDSDVEQVCSTIVGYNCQTFSWAAVWCDKTPDIDGYVTIYLRYDTYKRCRLIEVCRVPYEWVR